MANKNSPALLVRTARNLAAVGYTVLRFDFRGSGDSEGRFEEQNIDSEIKDLNAAVDFLRKRKSVDKEKIGVIGYSKGGMIAAIGAAKNKRIKCIATWGLPNSLKEIWKKSLVRRIFLKRYIYNVFGFKITKQLLLNDFKWKLTEVVQEIKQPLLIVHGTRDSTVSMKHAIRIYKSASEPKKLELVKGTNHYFSQEEHFNTLYAATLEWFDIHLRGKKEEKEEKI